MNHFYALSLSCWTAAKHINCAQQWMNHIDTLCGLSQFLFTLIWVKRLRVSKYQRHSITMQNNAKCQKKNPKNATNSFTVRNTSHFDVNELLCCDLVKDDDFKQSMIMIDHFSVRALKWNLFNWSSQIICHGKMANNFQFTSQIFVDLVMVSFFMLENYPKSWAIFSSSFYIGWAIANVCQQM